jgi:2'-5' RNA ligase
LTRAFVAVRLPDTVLDAVAERTAAIDAPGRRTTREQWHLTLQFLGNRADVDAVTAALGDLDVAAGPAQLGGAGAFPRASRGTVLWLGVTEGSELLAQLAGAVVQRTARLGYEPDDRPYRPHLTLARCRSPQNLRSVIASIGDEPVGPPWRVDAVTVFESETRAEGARYLERATIALPG